MMNAMHADMSGVDPLIDNLTHRVAVGDMLTRGAQTYGDRVAVVDGTQTVTYRQLEARANAVARGLLDQGLEHGDALALQMGNRWEFLATFFACAKIGVIVLPLNLGLSTADVAHQLVDSGVQAAVTEEMFAPALEAALLAARGGVMRFVAVVDTAPASLAGLPARAWAGLLERDEATIETLVEDRDILQCLYTSGTTSKPKGVLTSHVAVQIAVLGSALHFGLRPRGRGEVMPIVLPLFHVTALNVLALPMLLTGGTLILHRQFDPGAILDDIAGRDASYLMLLPAMWRALLEHPQTAKTDTSKVKLGIYAMAPMPAQVLAALRETFSNAEIVLGSGQTEATPLNELQWPEHQGVKDDSWGPASITSDVRIMAPDGRLLPRRETGEIVYRTPQLMEGYWDNPRANSEAFANGWFHGGDVGYIDDEGVVWFTDRIKDMVKTGGENVSSVEVERIILAYPEVAECAVIGTPDERWGEAVTAFVVVKEGATTDAETLRAYCKERLAGFKVPKRFEFIASLPKTSTGKITKHLLRNPRA